MQNAALPQMKCTVIAAKLFSSMCVNNEFNISMAIEY